MNTHLTKVEEAFALLCEQVDTPISLGLFLRFKYKEHRQLLELSIDPERYESAQSFGADYACFSFLSKWKGLHTQIDVRKAAISSWSAAEEVCRISNERLGSLNDFATRLITECGCRALQAITLAQHKIFKVLGCSPDLPAIFRSCRWSGGATYALRRGSTITQKATETLDVTTRAWKWLRWDIEHDPVWSECLLGVRPSGPYRLLDVCTFVRGNRLVTVPKNAKTDRVIAAEPSGNAFLQQGVGRYMRSRLKAFGVDLDDQSINRELASKACSTGLATLDLSAASDSVSKSLVSLLLPADWVHFLDDLRSPETFVDGSWIRLQKFSSMGNAFTFELESLIFWAVSSAVTQVARVEGPVSVYGDDIIVPVDAYAEVVRVLSFLGFTVNQSKSFSSGPFRESCGGHFFNGVDVTPPYQRELVDSLSEVIKLHNRLYRWSRRLGFDGRGFRRRLFNLLGSSDRQMPDFLVDDRAFLVPPEFITPDQNGGYWFKALVPITRCVPDNHLYLYAYKLRQRSWSSPDLTGRAATILPSRTVRYRSVRTVAYRLGDS